MNRVPIDPDDQVSRRLAPDTVDYSTNLVRRNAFYRRGEPDADISVHVGRLAGNPEAILERAGRPSFGVGSILVADLLDLGCAIEHRPTADDPSHAVILGVSTRADCDRIASVTTIVRLPKPESRQA